MAFSEQVKLSVKKQAHFRCCLCHELFVEIHHIIPQSEGGQDTESNAAPLCPSCHETYGANPEKRKFIRETRDFWYELCAKRYPIDNEQIKDVLTDALKNVATKDDLGTTIGSELLACSGFILKRRKDCTRPSPLFIRARGLYPPTDIARAAQVDLGPKQHSRWNRYCICKSEQSVRRGYSTLQIWQEIVGPLDRRG